MPEPTGENTFRGLALPAYGEWEQVQRNSSATMITLTHSTANAGLYMVGRNSVSSQFFGPGSSAQGGLTFAISAVGGYSVRSGTTVLAELNSSGLYLGTTQIIGPGGSIFPGTVTINTTASTLVSSNSGKIHILSTQAATSNFIYLPTAPNARAGDSWEIISNTTAVSLWNLVVNGTSGQIFVHQGTTAVVVTTGAVDTTATTGAMWWEVVCLSTVLPSYALHNKMAPSISITTAASFYHTGAGTTA
jgi:hypothetical protein